MLLRNTYFYSYLADFSNPITIFALLRDDFSSPFHHVRDTDLEVALEILIFRYWSKATRNSCKYAHIAIFYDALRQNASSPSSRRAR